MDNILDIEALTAPLSDDAPCGTDMREDPSFDSPYQRLKNAREEAMAVEREDRSSQVDESQTGFTSDCHTALSLYGFFSWATTRIFSGGSTPRCVVSSRKRNVPPEANTNEGLSIWTGSMPPGLRATRRRLPCLSRLAENVSSRISRKGASTS